MTVRKQDTQAWSVPLLPSTLGDGAIGDYREHAQNSYVHDGES